MHLIRMSEAGSSLKSEVAPDDPEGSIAAALGTFGSSQVLSTVGIRTCLQVAQQKQRSCKQATRAFPPGSSGLWNSQATVYGVEEGHTGQVSGYMWAEESWF